jgi:hypothetical protein
MRSIEEWERMSWQSLETKALVIDSRFRKPNWHQEADDY